MNGFFTDDFQISKINFCTLVRSGTGQPIHKNRPYHGLVCQISGEKRYIFDSGRSMTVREGDVFYLPKASNYRVANIVSGDCIAVNFELFDRSVTYESFVLAPSNFEQYRQKFTKLDESWTTKKTGFQNKCLSLIYGIIYDIQREMDKSYTAPDTKRIVQTAFEYINQNISNHCLTVEDVADHLNITPEYLRRLFKNEYGISPRQFIIRTRMKNAAELILSDEFSISEISRMCGYDSESYFSTEFKHFYGIQPSQYCTNKA